MRPCTVNGMQVGGGASVRLMGVINCSPESFFSGSYVPEATVRERAFQMIDAGADLIDLGARSTAPHSVPITVQEEIGRITAALSALDGSGITLSVDTMYPEVLEACLRHDVHAINDIGGLANSAYATVAADAGLPVIGMAAQHRPGDPRGTAATLDALKEVSARAERAGITDLILDPAVGNWTAERTFDDDWDLCRHFDRFQELGRPVLIAISRKSYLGDLVGRPSEERLAATLAVTTRLLPHADMVRAHDVAATRDTILVVEKMEMSR
ncbi:dihydropteroate synthase [Methanofollis aquaemaris]|uniref:dihydropteroate synthase n=1 Tax=Methanofollis aquaemaris TaxID=126734 RepID=A0A8A3S6D7_9EURY|nr:dihydropteroate synthase [Methanofollis aquaemaris]QSZ67718.1 dihydropteroate synthase [Methanofollis aquaemaris]